MAPRKRSGCSFRIRSPCVREFLAETIGILSTVQYSTVQYSGDLALSLQAPTSSCCWGRPPSRSPSSRSGTRETSSASTGGDHDHDRAQCDCLLCAGGGWG